MNMIVNNDTGVGVITLKHDDRVIINGRKGHVGTVRGMAIQYTGVSSKYNTNPEEDVKISLAKGFEIYWINQEATCLCGDKGYYEIERAKWENAIRLEDGQSVMIEGDLRKVHYKGNYSDMASFIKHTENCKYESALHGCNNTKIGDCMCYNPQTCKGYYPKI
jgi:hypothetical protein